MKQKKIWNLCICLLTTVSLCLAACGSTSEQKTEAVSSAETTVASTAKSGDIGSSTEITATVDSESTEEEIDIIPAESEYAYSLIVSINPECELYFDAHDVVVGFAYLNEDAKTAYYQPDYTWIGLSLEDSMTQLITAADKAGFIKEEPAVKIELASVTDGNAVTDSSMLDRAEAAITKTLVPETSEVSDENSGSGDTGLAQETSGTASSGNTSASSAASTTDASSAGTTADTSVVPVIEKTVNEEVKEEYKIKVMITCPTCGGAGIWCDLCHNTGTGTCTHCGGTGVGCPDCGGTGKVNCFGCNGQGSYSCKACGGAGSYTCKVCGGGGMMGDQVCNGCGGSGRVSCNNCGGSGRETCNHCHGSGKETCEYCGGTNACKFCRGSGTHPCDSCGGTPGTCTTCNGAGEIEQE